MELLQLRQIALVARDLDMVRETIRAVFGLDHFHVDPAVGKFGLRNCVFVLGGTFLEVVSPLADGTTAGRLLEKRGGDGGYMVIVQTDQLDRARKRIAAADVRIVAEYNQAGAAFLHLHPRDTGGALLSLDAMDGEGRWDWAGADWQDHARTPGGCRIAGVEIQAPAPATTAHRWAEVLGSAAERHENGQRIALSSGTIDFAPIHDNRGEGLHAVVLSAKNADEIRHRAGSLGLLREEGTLAICGTLFRIVSP